MAANGIKQHGHANNLRRHQQYNFRFENRTTIPSEHSEGLAYYDSNAGNKHLYYCVDDTVPVYARVLRGDTAETITGLWTFHPASAGGQPFAVHSNGTGRVDNLNADRVDSFHASQSVVANTLATRNGDGTLSGADPTSNEHFVTLGYVTNLIDNYDPKDPCEAATTGNIDVSSAPATFDGYAASNGDRIFVWQQVAGEENGIRVFQGVGNPMPRASDADEDNEVTSGMQTLIRGGNTHTGAIFMLKTADPIVLDTDALEFVQVGGNTLYSDGRGLTKSGNTFHAVQSGAYSVGDIVFANSADTLTFLTAVATGNVLKSGGETTAPVWGKVDLTADVTGTLGVTNGGTGNTNQFTKGSVVYASDNGVYSQSNTLFFWDEGNNALGLGTKTLTAGNRLQVSLGRIAVSDGYNIGDIDGDTGFFVNSNTTNIQTAGTTRFKVDASGNAGLGLTTYSSRLTVKDATDTGLSHGIQIIRSANADSGYINVQGGALSFNTVNDAGTGALPIQWSLNGVVAMKLDTSANLAIGAGIIATEKLHVGGNIRLADGAARSIIGPADEDLKIIASPNSTLEGIKWYVDGGTTPGMVLLQTGKVGIGDGIAPDELLHLYTGSAEDIKLRMDSDSTGSAYIELDRQTTAGKVGIILQDGTTTKWTFGDLNGNNSFVFDSALVSDAFVILQNGNIGIGATSSDGKLHVNGSIRFTGSEIVETADSGVVDFASGYARLWALGSDATTRDNGIQFIVAESDFGNSITAFTISNDGTLTAGVINTGTGNSILTEESGVIKKRTINAGAWTTFGADKLLFSNSSGDIISDSEFKRNPTANSLGLGGNAESNIRVKIYGLYPSVTVADSNYYQALHVLGSMMYDIATGVTDSGYRVGLEVGAYVSDANFLGTLNEQYAVWARHGVNASGVGSVITNSYGVYIDSLTNANTTITNLWGLYQASSAAKNYFAGKVGIGSATSPSCALDILQTSDVVTGGTTPVAIRIGATNQDAGANTWNTASDFVQLQLHSSDASGEGAGNRWTVGVSMRDIAGSLSKFNIRDISGTSRFTIDSLNGNIGIGTTSPNGTGWDESSRILHIYKNTTNGALLKLESSNTAAILNAGNNQLSLFTTSADPIVFGTGGTERMRIDSGGAINFVSPVGIWNTIGAGGLKFARETYFGYSGTYKVLEIGEAAATRGIAIGVDVSTNLSGSFNGNEIIFPVDRNIITPNVANNAYIGLFGIDSSEVLHIGSSTFNVKGGGHIRVTLSSGGVWMNGAVTLNTIGTGTGNSVLTEESGVVKKREIYSGIWSGGAQFLDFQNVDAVVDGTDLNTESNGLYENYGGNYWLNEPAGAAYGAVWSQVRPSDNLGFQLFFDIRSGNTDYGNLFLRTKNTSGWATWRKLWHDGNDGAGSGLHADLLDGQEGSYYLTASNIGGLGNNRVVVTEGTGKLTSDSALLWDGNGLAIGASVTALLSLGGGTTTKAPLKFTAGPLLSTEQVGAMEYSNESEPTLYFTRKAGARKRVVLAHEEDIGDGSNSTFTITHDLGAKPVSVVGTFKATGETFEPDWDVIDNDTISVTYLEVLAVDEVSIRVAA